jgi:hypothetical protein
MSSSSWKEPYLAALTEPDKEKLTGLLYATELAMFLRAQELTQSADGHQGLIEIAIASENLLALKTMVLNWSSPIQVVPFCNQSTVYENN